MGKQKIRLEKHLEEFCGFRGRVWKRRHISDDSEFDPPILHKLHYTTHMLAALQLGTYEVYSLDFAHGGSNDDYCGSDNDLSDSGESLVRKLDRMDEVKRDRWMELEIQCLKHL